MKRKILSLALAASLLAVAIPVTATPYQDIVPINAEIDFEISMAFW